MNTTQENSILNFLNISRNEPIGFIGNYVTYEILSNYLNIIDITDYENNISEKDVKIKNLIIEDKIYEKDHIFSRMNIETINSIFDGARVIRISNNLEDNYELEDIKIVIDARISEVKYTNDQLYLPIVFNEKKYNPSESNNDFELLSCFLEDSNFENSLERFYKQNIVQVANPDNITRDFIVSLLNALKNTNIFIFEDRNFDKVLAKYIEIIAVAQNAHVIIDTDTPQYYDFSEIIQNEDHLVNLIRFLINNPEFVNKTKVKTFRSLMLNKSLLYLENTTPKVSVTLVSMREERLERILIDIGKQKFVSTQIVLLTHGYKLPNEKIEELSKLGDFELKVIEGDKSLILGECLNKCIDYVDNNYVVKMDDDDYYYPYFILDLYIGLSYSQAEIVGKYGFYFYLNELNLVGSRRTDKEYRNVSEVKGNGIFCETSLLNKYKFSELRYGEDSDLFERVRKNKGRIYSIHSFDMCVFRDGDKSKHSYKVNDINFLRDAKTIYFGEPNNTISTE